MFLLCNKNKFLRKARMRAKNKNFCSFSKSLQAVGRFLGTLSFKLKIARDHPMTNKKLFNLFYP